MTRSRRTAALLLAAALALGACSGGDESEEGGDSTSSLPPIITGTTLTLTDTEQNCVNTFISEMQTADLSDPNAFANIQADLLSSACQQMDLDKFQTALRARRDELSPEAWKVILGASTTTTVAP